VDPARLREALDRAQSLLALQRGASLADRLEGLLAQQTAVAPDVAAAPRADRLVVREGDRLSFVEIEAVDRFESAGNHVRVHSAGHSYLMRTTMDRMAQRLSARGEFVRVRRSAIVNVRAIDTLERYGKSAFIVRLRDGAKIISSRFYQPALRRLLRAGR
jgi:two-component system LytT family response regulator